MAEQADTSSQIPVYPDEAALIQRCLHGDNSAFDVLYGRYRLQLFAYLGRLLRGHREQVEDIFQMVWVKALRNLNGYTEKQRFLPWLCRIGHNLAMDYFRQHRCSVPETMPEVTDARLTPPEKLQRRQMMGALEAAIATLPPEQQRVVRLRKDGVPFKEIAEREGVSLNTALGRMHYAVLKLKKMLEDYL